MSSNTFIKSTPKRYECKPFSPKCSDCKYSKIIKYENSERMVCKLFAYNFKDISLEESYMDAFTCRYDVNLCGKEALYFQYKE